MWRFLNFYLKLVISVFIEISSDFLVSVYLRPHEPLFHRSNYPMFMFIHGFTLYIVQDQVKDLVPVSMTASDLNIPGLYLLHDFISATEEEVY